MPGHILDANTLALWRLDEMGGTFPLAEARGVYPLTTGTMPVLVAGIADAARDFNGASNFGQGNGDVTAVAELLGEWTAEAWIRLDAVPGAGSRGCIVCYMGNGETEVLNALMSMYVTPGRFLEAYWEHGAGIDDRNTQSAGATIPLNVFTHVAVVKRQNGATWDVEFWINGVRQQTINEADNATGGDNSVWSIGRSVTANEFFNGVIDDVRISHVARSAAEIQESYSRGWQGILGIGWLAAGKPDGGIPQQRAFRNTIGNYVKADSTIPADTTRPVISSFSPSPGTALAKDTPIGFDVTDNANSFRRIIIVADYPAVGLREVIHDSDTFSRTYEGSSRSSIVNGFHYSVLRKGGWPASPTLIPFAIDTAGNEAA